MDLVCDKRLTLGFSKTLTRETRESLNPNMPFDKGHLAKWKNVFSLFQTMEK